MIKRIFLLFFLSLGFSVTSLAADVKKPSSCQSCHVQVKEKLKRCGKCHETTYCSKACQKNHWPVHKIDCVLLEARHLFKKYYFFTIDKTVEHQSPEANFFFRAITKDAASTYVEYMIGRLKEGDVEVVSLLHSLKNPQ